MLLLSSLSLIAQDNRRIIFANVQLDTVPFSDIHVVNFKTKKGTITDSKGSFQIKVQLGDTLNLSHIKLKNKKIIISKEDVINGVINIKMEEEINTLNEFTLIKPKSIFYQDPTIKTYTGPKVTAKTLQLPYANAKRKKSNTIIEANSGGIISLNNLIRELNGTNRRNKIANKMASEDKQLLKIRTYFTDDFFITTLHIKKENINSFLNFCLKKNILIDFKKNDLILLTQKLLLESKSFPQKENSEIKLAFKKDSI